MKHFLFITAIVLIAVPGFSQDSLIVVQENDTALIESYAKRYNPRKALLFAAVVPGLGQIYNKKYWKLPLVYGGMYLVANRGIKFWNDVYRDYKAQLFYNLENNLRGANDVNPASGYTTGQLRRVVDKARRERDFMVIIMGGIYLLQMVDAHVDAHLKEFDLNPNLHVRLEPVFEQNAVVGRQSGLALRLRF